MAVISRDGVVMMAIGGAAAGSVAGVAALFLKFGAQTSDVFALFGCVIGAAAAIAGVAWGAGREKVQERNEERLPIQTEVRQIVAITNRARALIESEESSPQIWWDDVRILSEQLNGVELFFGDVVSHARTLTFNDRMAIRRVIQRASLYGAFYKGFEEGSVHPTRQAWLHEMDEIEEAALDVFDRIGG